MAVDRAAVPRLNWAAQVWVEPWSASARSAIMNEVASPPNSAAPEHFPRRLRVVDAATRGGTISESGLLARRGATVVLAEPAWARGSC